MTVNQAFADFMQNTVNLDSEVVKAARKSRDNLLDNISEFSEKDGFFNLYSGFNVQFGSFARKTKCRELDDIDMMIGISADGATYTAYREWNDIQITPSITSEAQQNCLDENGYLNSRKVVERFKRQLQNVREYKKSEIKRNHEAVVLNLLSRDWSFDIVPCFHTVEESDGRDYYLIPNGEGHWKKTNPIKDREFVTNQNQLNDGKLLALIRLVKYWNKHSSVVTLPSYLLETLLVNYAQLNNIPEHMNERFKNALEYVRDNIFNPVYDMKRIQGNINNIPLDDKGSFYNAADGVISKSDLAIAWEKDGYDETALQIWHDILGENFPTK